MAKAKVVHDKVTVELTLSEEELLFLKCVIDRVGGSPYISARKHSDAIGCAINPIISQHGLYNKYSAMKQTLDVQGSLMFGKLD